jgi:hypothetical protein
MGFCTACGRPRSGQARFCAGCGAPFPEAVSTEAPFQEVVSTDAPADEPPATVPPLAVTGHHPDTVAAYYPPGGQATPEQPGTAPGQQPSGDAAEHDLFSDLFVPREDSGGSPERFEATAAGQGYENAGQGYGSLDQGYQGYRNAGPRDLLTSPPPGGRGKAVLAVLAAVVVLAAGGGVALWVTHRHHAGNGAPSAQPGPSGTGSQGSHGPSSPAQSPTPAPTPTPTPTTTPTSSGSLVTVAPGVAQEPDASQVESYVISYFTAINNHSYQQYLALLDRKMRRHESPQKFSSGYHSTTDSRAVLSAISSIGPGRVGAAVTFTSHQLPADSASKTACTDWSITLHLIKQGGRFVLGPSPPGYQAVYHAC